VNAIAALVVVVLALLGTAPASAQVTAKGTVVIAQGVDANSLDPMISQTTPTWNVTSTIFDTLVEWGPGGKLVPALAESYRIVNPMTWEFKLRKGVKFQNGEPFEASVVAFSIDRLNNNPKSRNAYMKGVKAVEVIDAHTVRLITSPANPILDKQLFSAAMFPPKYLAQVGDEEFAKRPVGTGPYRVVRWTKDDRLVLEAFADHWRGAAKIKNVIFRAIPDDSTRVGSLQTGEVDLIANVPPHLADTLAKASDFKVHRIPSIRTIYVVINTLAKSPLQDVRVRRAVNMAVDVDQIVKDVLGGYGRPLQSELSPLLFGHDPSVKRYPFDPAGAQRLLAEAGYPNGFETVLNTPSGRYLKDREVAEALTGFLGKVGIRAKLEVHEFGSLLRQLYAKKMPGLTFWGWGLPSRDADSWFRFTFHSQGKVNYYQNPALDKLVEAGASQMDPAARRRIYREALELAHREAVHLPLYYADDIYAAKASLNFAPGNDEHIVAFDLSFR
jgi:peptide/nickel transport system substrate-binding protein